MMRVVFTVAGVAILAVLGTVGSVSAKITQYECRFDQERGRGGGWIPEVLFITDNDETGEVLAFDPIIKYFYDKPIPARRASQSKARATFTWEVDARANGQSARMIYSMSYFSNGQPAKVRAQPGGYDNTWTGQGRCTLSTQ
jgi:hypothetical protein